MIAFFFYNYLVDKVSLELQFSIHQFKIFILQFSNTTTLELSSYYFFFQVELYFRDLEVDAYYDYIYLIDGDTPTIASSFNDITGVLSDIEPSIIAPSNVLTLVFESDILAEFRGGAADVYFIGKTLCMHIKSLLVQNRLNNVI